MATPGQWYFTKALVSILIVRTARMYLRAGKMLLLLGIGLVGGVGHNIEEVEAKK
jgi:hypothetical protein